jgi:hypothetical protein
MLKGGLFDITIKVSVPGGDRPRGCLRTLAEMIAASYLRASDTRFLLSKSPLTQDWLKNDQTVAKVQCAVPESR